MHSNGWHQKSLQVMKMSKHIGVEGMERELTWKDGIQSRGECAIRNSAHRRSAVHQQQARASDEPMLFLQFDTIPIRYLYFMSQ